MRAYEIDAASAMKAGYLHRMVNEIFPVLHAVASCQRGTCVHHAPVALDVARVEYFVVINLLDRATGLQQLARCVVDQVVRQPVALAAQPDHERRVDPSGERVRDVIVRNNIVGRPQIAKVVVVVPAGGDVRAHIQDIVADDSIPVAPAERHPAAAVANGVATDRVILAPAHGEGRAARAGDGEAAQGHPLSTGQAKISQKTH